MSKSKQLTRYKHLSEIRVPNGWYATQSVQVGYYSGGASLCIGNEEILEISNIDGFTTISIKGDTDSEVVLRCAEACAAILLEAKQEKK